MGIYAAFSPCGLFAPSAKLSCKNDLNDKNWLAAVAQQRLELISNNLNMYFEHSSVFVRSLDTASWQGVEFVLGPSHVFHNLRVQNFMCVNAIQKVHVVPLVPWNLIVVIDIGKFTIQAKNILKMGASSIKTSLLTYVM